jgi:acetyl esterase/lipase
MRASKPPPTTRSPRDQFAEGYFLRRDAMQWFLDRYTTDDKQHAEITASPLRATVEQLVGPPLALVITGEADVLRDEGGAYANKLRTGGFPVTAVRYEGIWPHGGSCPWAARAPASRESPEPRKDRRQLLGARPRRPSGRRPAHSPRSKQIKLRRSAFCSA